MTIAGGGWPSVVLGNGEQSTRYFTTGFADSMGSYGDPVVVRQVGNATNSMIQRWGDNDFLEKGNVACIFAHGNVGYINLELTKPGGLVADDDPFFYSWGDGGVLQWILVHSCEVLGFCLDPSGNVSLNPYWSALSPKTWNETFKGISGICGYRSDSWGTPGPIMTTAARILVQELRSGKTFFTAWCSSSDYLHRALGKRAQPAVFCSSSGCLNDTLTRFFPKRQRGIDPQSIRYKEIGSGEAASFEAYHPSVEYDGSPRQGVTAKLAWDERVKEARTVQLPQRVSDLPVFRYRGSGLPIDNNNLLASASASRTNAAGETVLHDIDAELSIDELEHELASSVTSNSILGSRCSVLTGQYAGLRGIETDKAGVLPIVFDAGVRVTSDESGLSLVGTHLEVDSLEGTQAIADPDVAIAAVQAEIGEAGSAVIKSITYAYEKVGTVEEGLLRPCLRISYLHSADGGHTISGTVTTL